MTLGVTNDDNYNDIADALREVGVGMSDATFTPSQMAPAIRGLRSIWGNIEGQLANQSDLQNALNAKANSADLGDMAAEDDAPSDDKQYGRKNGDWVPITDELANWGQIAGTLSDQTDLQNALNAKSPLVHDHDDRYYTESEVDEALDLKADADSVYTKTETDTLLDEKAPAITETASGSIASFTDGSALPVENLTVSIEPVQTGSGDPSPTNIRPISGCTEALVRLTKKNLLPLPTWFITDGTYTSSGITFTLNADKSISISGTATANVSMTLTNNLWLKPEKYTALFAETQNTNLRLQIREDSSSGADIFDTVYTTRTKTITKTVKAYVRIYIPKNTVLNTTVYPMLALVDSLTIADYESYQGQVVTIDLGEERYGGTLDVTTGILTIDREIWTDFSTLYANGQSNKGAYRYRKDLSRTAGYADGACISNMLRYSVGFNGYANDFYNNSGHFLIFLDAPTADEAKQFLASNGCQIVYPLASPFTVQLTPSQMQTLLGENHIWADTGDVKVTYRADSKLYIDQKVNEAIRKTKQIIAAVTDTMVAPSNLTAGDFIIVGDDLLKATSNIASGATLTIGSNCVKTTVAEALIALASV